MIEVGDDIIICPKLGVTKSKVCHQWCYKRVKRTKEVISNFLAVDFDLLGTDSLNYTQDVGKAKEPSTTIFILHKNKKKKNTTIFSVNHHKLVNFIA